MLYHLTDIISMHSVEDGKEVLAIGVSILWVLILQVQHDLRVISEAGKDILDGELVILGHVDVTCLVDLEQLLLAGEHCLQEVSVDTRGRWNQILNYSESVRMSWKDLRCSLQ